MAKRPVVVVVGTRPEAIKMAPVVFALRESTRLRPVLLSTGQHRTMLDQALATFGLAPDIDLDVMRPDQRLDDLLGRLIPAVGAALGPLKAAAVLVQGDTTSTLAGALAAFHAGVPVGHVEAGLRTGDPANPFPEEMNRRLVDHLAAWLFPPTKRGAAALRAEGIPAARIVVTGNTVVDALRWVRRNRPPAWPSSVPRFPKERTMLLVTAHRRESFGRPLRDLCTALRTVVREFPDVDIVYPVHLNPNVRRAVHRALGATPRIHLVEPVGYEELLALVDRSRLVLTDSGGLQEEAPSLGRPVLVMRRATERPEGIEQGTSLLVGTDPERILRACRRLLRSESAWESMARTKNPFGDGRAARRIVARLERDLARG
jgi:UDP-N-acetylglucosamine 2-epimerase (non-hydrolysing)